MNQRASMEKENQNEIRKWSETKNYNGMQFFTQFKPILTGKETPIVSLIRQFDASQYLMKKAENQSKLCTTNWGEWLRMMESNWNDHLIGCLESGQTRIWESVLERPELASFRSALLILTILEWRSTRVELDSVFRGLNFFFGRFKFTAGPKAGDSVIEGLL